MDWLGVRHPRAFHSLTPTRHSRRSHAPTHVSLGACGAMIWPNQNFPTELTANISSRYAKNCWPMLVGQVRGANCVGVATSVSKPRGASSEAGQTPATWPGPLTAAVSQVKTDRFQFAEILSCVV